MNCRTFHGLLHEYLDETLDAELQGAARQHLQQCNACRNAFLREQAFATSMRQSLDRATAGLSLRPGMRQDVLDALGSKRPLLGAWRGAWQDLIASRPAGSVAALVGAALVLLCIQYYRRAPNEAARHGNAQTGHYSCVINVPISTRTHVFRLQGNAVVDSIADESSVADARLSEEREQPPPRP